MKVLTYNVEVGGHHRAETLDAIDHADADLVLLQETTASYERVLRQRFAARYPHVSFHHWGRYAGGLTVLSRAPIVEDLLMPPEHGWFPAQRLVLDDAIGRVQVLHVHLRPMLEGGDPVRGYLVTPPIRRREIESFWTAIDPALPIIVAGDFNEEPGGLALQWLAERGVARVDTGPEHTWSWKGRWNGNDVHLRLRLDHVCVDDRLIASDARVLDAGGSDHRPVAVTLAAAR